MRMLGQVVFSEDGKGTGKLEYNSIMELPVLRGTINPKVRWYRWRLKRMLCKMQQKGVRRILVASDFCDWDVAESQGLSGVSSIAFLRENAAEILLLAMKKARVEINRSTVAVYGTQVSREIIIAAEKLVPYVRDISISAQNGGEYLQTRLRKQWGIAVHPSRENMDGIICFDENCRGSGMVKIVLCQGSVQLGGLRVSEDKIADFQGIEPLSVLGALWETGHLRQDEIEFYLT